MTNQRRIAALLGLALSLLLTIPADADVLVLKRDTVTQLIPGRIYDKVEGLEGIFFAAPQGSSIAGRKNQFEPYPIIRLPNTREGYAFKFVSRFVLSGVRIEGAGIFVEGPGGVNSDSVIDDCEIIHRYVSGTKKNAVEFSCFMRRTKFTRNLVSGDGFGLFTDKGYEDVLVANNIFDGPHAAIHLDANQPSRRLTIEQNLIRDVVGMGIELQGNAEEVTIQDNWYEDPSKTFHTSKMAYSVILDKSKRIRTLRNVHISPTVQQEPISYVRDVFECGGDDHLVEDNYSDGGNCIMAGNDGVGTTSVMVRNNRFGRYREAMRLSFPAQGRTLNGLERSNDWQGVMAQFNNTPTTQLSPAMMDRIANNRKPQRFARYGETPTPPPPSPDPTIAELKAQIAALQKQLNETAAAATAERATLQAQIDQLKAFLRDLGAKATAAGN